MLTGTTYWQVGARRAGAARGPPEETRCRLIKSSLRLPLLGLAVLIAAGLLLASSGRWRGLFVSRGSTEPVDISRSGGQGSEAEAPLSGPSTITGPTVVTTTATKYVTQTVTITKATTTY